MRENDNVAQGKYGIGTTRCRRRDVRHIISFPVPFRDTLPDSLGIRTFSFLSERKVEFRNTEFKSSEQTALRSGKTRNSTKLSAGSYSRHSGYPQVRNRVADEFHISVISRCKSVVRLYQQSAIRSKRKIGLHQVRRKFRKVAPIEKARTDAGL